MKLRTKILLILSIILCLTSAIVLYVSVTRNELNNSLILKEREFLNLGVGLTSKSENILLGGILTGFEIKSDNSILLTYYYDYSEQSIEIPIQKQDISFEFYLKSCEFDRQCTTYSLISALEFENSLNLIDEVLILKTNQVDNNSNLSINIYATDNR